MFQRGTGERFKYKAAVKHFYPEAYCKSVFFGGTGRFYLVKEMIGGKMLSTFTSRAETAWENVWCNILTDEQRKYNP